ncbi:hypothetical protein MPSEU_000391300 [Mayamaea pseudoterrestris]|nr:hypothetical protein MPSEU_000391300 [Mayamaea pseudoterrestris]
MTSRTFKTWILALLPVAHCFSTTTYVPRNSPSLHVHSASTRSSDHGNSALSRHQFFRNVIVSGLVAASAIVSQPGVASEIGVEVEAPTLYTGENVMICKKRGPLGACLETVVRTDENDNDKARKYFADPVTLIKKELTGPDDSELSAEGSALIEKLRRQTKDNFEKNELEIQRRTFENGQSAISGPFSRQVLIMNTDGKTFTLLDNPQAMRMKDAGL